MCRRTRIRAIPPTSKVKTSDDNGILGIVLARILVILLLLLLVLDECGNFLSATMVSLLHDVEEDTLMTRPNVRSCESGFGAGESSCGFLLLDVIVIMILVFFCYYD